MALLSAEELRVRRPRETRDVDVPELGGSVRICAWTGAEKDDWEYILFKRDKDSSGDPRGVRAAAVVVSLVDESGKRVLSVADVAAVNAWPQTAVQAVWEAVSELNRIGPDAVEDAEKN